MRVRRLLNNQAIKQPIKTRRATTPPPIAPPISAADGSAAAGVIGSAAVVESGLTVVPIDTIGVVVTNTDEGVENFPALDPIEVPTLGNVRPPIEDVDNVVDNGGGSGIGSKKILIAAQSTLTDPPLMAFRRARNWMIVFAKPTTDQVASADCTNGALFSGVPSATLMSITGVAGAFGIASEPREPI